MSHPFRRHPDVDDQFTLGDCVFPSGDQRLYTIEEAAALLHLDPNKLAHAVRTGVIRSHSGRNGAPLLRLADVHTAIDCFPDGGWR